MVGYGEWLNLEEVDPPPWIKQRVSSDLALHETPGEGHKRSNGLYPPLAHRGRKGNDNSKDKRLF